MHPRACPRTELRGTSRGCMNMQHPSVPAESRWWRLGESKRGSCLPYSASGCLCRRRRRFGGVGMWPHLPCSATLGRGYLLRSIEGWGDATRGIARGWPHCGKYDIAILVEFGVWLFRNGAFVWYWLRENYPDVQEVSWWKHTRADRNARCVMPRFKPKTRESSVDSTKTITRLLKCRERGIPQIRPESQRTGDCGIRSNRCDVRHTSRGARRACIASVIVCERL